MENWKFELLKTGYYYKVYNDLNDCEENLI